LRLINCSLISYLATAHLFQVLEWAQPLRAMGEAAALYKTNI
jgi:hypothetical protein